MDTRKKPVQKRTIVLAVILLAILLASYLTMAFLKLRFNITGEHIFAFESGRVQQAGIMKNDNGQIAYWEENETECQEIVSHLNNFRYRYSITIPEEYQHAGFSYLLYLEIDGQLQTFAFEQNAMIFGERLYFGDLNYFNKFTDLFVGMSKLWELN